MHKREGPLNMKFISMSNNNKKKQAIQRLLNGPKITENSAAKK